MKFLWIFCYQRICNVMIVKIIEDNLFKNLTTNREDRYWPVVFN